MVVGWMTSALLVLIAAAVVTGLPSGRANGHTVRAPSPSCSTAEDCSLNGDCTDGACVCDKPWAGPNCQRLVFLPAASKPETPSCKDSPACVYHGDGTSTTTSWGGSIVLHDDGSYYMAVAEMANNCSLGQWTTNSQVAIVTSKSPTGPFKKLGVAVTPWSHNPEMVRNVDGSYLIYTLGNGTAHGTEKDCRKGSSPADAAAGVNPQAEEHDGNHTVGFVIHRATSPLGPWTAHTAIMPGFQPSWNMKNWNPAPVVLPDGRIRVMVHTNPAPWAGLTIVEAASWEGPYIPITGDVSPCEKCEEDPFMWVDNKGNWHVLYHRMFDPAGGSPVPSPGWCGGHAFSKDGLKWSSFSNLDDIGRSYNTSIPLDNGHVFEVERRERPKLLINSKGVLTHLYNGAITSDFGTYTVVAPLQV